jgi:hypothetical protein
MPDPPTGPSTPPDPTLWPDTDFDALVNGDRDPICDITRSELGQPMRHACHDLSIANLPAGHWVTLECKTEVTEAIAS